MKRTSTTPFLRQVRDVIDYMVQAQQLSREDGNRLLRYATKWRLTFTRTAGMAMPDLRESVAQFYAAGGLPPPAEIRWCRDPFELKEAMTHFRSAGSGSQVAPDRGNGGAWKALFRAYPQLPGGLEQAVRRIGYLIRDTVAGPWDLIERALGVQLSTTAGPDHAVVGPTRCVWLLRWDLAIHELGIAREGLAGLLHIIDATPCAAFFPEAALLLQRPAVLAFDEEGNLHREDGPAVRWGPAENPTAAVYAIRGRRVWPEVVEGGLAPELFSEHVWCGDYLLRRHGFLWLARSREARALASWSGRTQRWALVQVPVKARSSYHPITGLILEDRDSGAIWSTRIAFDNVRKDTKLTVPFTAAVWREQ